MARALAGVSRDHVDPNRIGADSVYYDYDPRRGQWSRVNLASPGMPSIRPVTDPARIRELDDTRALRLERQQLRQQFHPDDPSRHREQPILRSPRTLADAGDAGLPLAEQMEYARGVQPPAPELAAPVLQHGGPRLG